MVGPTIALPLLDSSRLGNHRTLLRLFWFADMSRSRRWGNSTGDEVKDGTNAIEDVVLSRQLSCICQRQIGSYSERTQMSARLLRWQDMEILLTLEFTIASLNLLVVSLLYIALEDSSSRGLVETGSFQDMCGIDPVVGLASHHMLSLCIWA